MIMLFAFGTAVMAGNQEKAKTQNSKKSDATEMVRYEVYIMMANEMMLCASYQVVVVDHFGNMVAPPQRYFPSKSLYTFYESVPVTGPRAAYLIKDSDNGMCNPNNYLYTNPDKSDGPFMGGMSYMFHLYPTNQRPAH